MPTTSARLGLSKPLTTDAFSTSVLAANWQKVDDFPGIFIAANAGALPSTWGAAHTGMFVWQTDITTLWRWTGSAFVRYGPKGYLGSNKRTTDLTVASGSYTTAASTSVTIPSGGRNVAVTASWSEITGGPARLALLRASTALTDWKATGDGGSVTFIDDAPSSGSGIAYSFQVKNTSTTTTLKASGTTPALIFVREV